jgi:RNA polymerase sigma-70 factor (ECF subfamily)
VAGKTTELAGEAYRESLDSSARHALLFERIAERIYGYFGKQVWDREQAEELAQRALVELERSLRERSYDPARSFNAWMWLKAHTVFAQWCRERGQRPAALAAEPAVGSHTGEIDARLDAEKVLREVQRRLGDETYEILVLVYEGGLTQTEVAEAVGRDRKTVATRLREARALAAELLDPPTPALPRFAGEGVEPEGGKP